MKTVILCGGKGTRLSEETVVKPKPMVEIGNLPILWHIMEIYSRYGYKDFILALGYKGDFIKEYFLNYFSKSCDFTVDLNTGSVQYHREAKKDWKVTLVDTGLESMTGGRLGYLKPYLNKDEEFMLTYGDGLCDVNISELVNFHKKHGRLATVTSVHPTARFGELTIENSRVTRFIEKPQTTEGWINGGFFVLSTKILEYISGPDCVFEKEPLERLAQEGQLMTFKHSGFWQCMDTLRDKEFLNSLYASGNAPWTRF